MLQFLLSASRFVRPTVAPLRTLHSSAPAFGGRNSGLLTARDVEWRSRLSKKAKKRQRRALETQERRATMMPAHDSGSGAAGALAAAGRRGGALMRPLDSQTVENARTLLPSARDLDDASARNRAVLQSMLVTTPHLDARAALVAENVDGWLAALSSGAQMGSAREWTHVVRVLGAQGRLKDALKALVAMRAASVAPTQATFVAVLSAAAAASAAPALAREIWSALLSAAGTVGAPSAVAWGAFLHALARGGDRAGALAALRDAAAAGISLNATHFTAIVVAQTAAGAYEAAEDAFHHMRTFHAQPDAVAYTALIVALGKRDRVEEAINLLWDMRDSGVDPTALTFNALIHVAARSIRLHEQAFSLAARMDAAGLAHDTRTTNALLLACSHKGDVTKAREIMSKFVGAGGAPNLITFNTLLTVYARALRRGTLEHVALLARGSGGGELVTADSTGTSLLAADASGELSDAKSIVEGIAPIFEGMKQKDAGHRAVLVNPLDAEGTTEMLLASYFGVRDPSEAAGMAAEAAFKAKSFDDLPVSVRPKLGDVGLDIKSLEYKRTRAALVEAGILDETLAEDVDDEHGSLQPLGLSAEEARITKYERRHRERIRKYEAESIELARLELEARRRSEYDPRERLQGTVGRFSDINGRVEELAPSQGGGTQIALTPHESSADLVLNAKAGGQRLSMRRYLAALEREIMTDLYGPEFKPSRDSDGDSDDDSDSDKIEVGEGNSMKRQWTTMFGESAASSSDGDASDTEIGGVPLRELLDPNTVPIPSASALGGVRKGGMEEAADYNPAALYAHIAGAVQDRLSAALVREAKKNIPEMSEVGKNMMFEYDDPALSDAEREGGGNSAPAGESARRLAEKADDEAIEKERNRRSFVARVMARVLQVHPLGPIERDLVAAAEGADKRRQRRIESVAPPTLLDALFAVQRLRSPASRIEPPPDADEEEAAAYREAAAAHAARAETAANRVVTTVAGDSEGAGARMDALVGLSDRVFAGATWARAADLPTSRIARRTVLLWELSRIYSGELVRAGMRPDATTVNVMLNAYCAAGDSRSAYTFLENDFPAAGVEPDVRSFRSLIRLHASVERRADAAAAAVRSMESLGLSPDSECLGLLAHAYAREWRLDEARAVIRRARDEGVRISDVYARLLRSRAKALDVVHDDIPEHPAGWQFSKQAMAKRIGGSQSKKVRKETKSLRPQRYGFS